ncbi:hypothetical protein [Arsukibacterium sp.]|uniref:hypothetical protein n=1 Tax=Arsukibacterium sp. TaxID=1977258 RepID=UPI00299E93B2|nr:hypothetical protein [Arsukibacterium sp.]MDX1539602.1 hypothetical protein [Arsukibacterium sp.]
MSRWKEQFKEHAIHQTISQLEEWLCIDLADTTPEFIVEFRRVEKVLRYLKRSISGLDPEITPIQQLDALNKNLQHPHIWNEVSTLSSVQTIAAITSINNQISGCLTHLTWMLPFSRKFSNRDSISSLENTVDKTLSAVIEEKNAYSEELSASTEEVRALRLQIEQLESTVEDHKKSADSQISQWQQQFSEAQEKRAEKYLEWREKVESEVRKQNTDLIQKSREEASLLKDAVQQELQELEQDASAKHQRIMELYELASGDSVAGGFSKTSNDETKQANIWRWISIGFIVATTFWLIFAYHQSTGTSIDAANAFDNFSWHKAFLSFSITGVLLFGAGYAGRQSSLHREEAESSRKFALQIKALDPYISSLDESVQQEVKKELTGKFFVGFEPKGASSDNLDQRTVKIMTQSITDVIKAAKGT